MTLRSGFGRYGGVTVDPTRYQFVVAARNRGLTLSQAQAALKGGGTPLRRQAISDIYRELSGDTERRRHYRNIRSDFRPDLSQIKTTARHFRTRFRYWGVHHTVDPETGEIFDIHVNFGDDRLLTPNEIRARTAAIVEAIAAKYGIDIDSDAFSITDIEQTEQ